MRRRRRKQEKSLSGCHFHQSTSDSDPPRQRERGRGKDIPIIRILSPFFTIYSSLTQNFQPKRRDLRTRGVLVVAVAVEQ